MSTVSPSAPATSAGAEVADQPAHDQAAGVDDDDRHAAAGMRSSTRKNCGERMNRRDVRPVVEAVRHEVDGGRDPDVEPCAPGVAADAGAARPGEEPVEREEREHETRGRERPRRTR